jgi:hypothetical protein
MCLPKILLGSDADPWWLKHGEDRRHRHGAARPQTGILTGGQQTTRPTHTEGQLEALKESKGHKECMLPRPLHTATDAWRRVEVRGEESQSSAANSPCGGLGSEHSHTSVPPP